MNFRSTPAIGEHRLIRFDASGNPLEGYQPAKTPEEQRKRMQDLSNRGNDLGTIQREANALIDRMRALYPNLPAAKRDEYKQRYNAIWARLNALSDQKGAQWRETGTQEANTADMLCEWRKAQAQLQDLLCKYDPTYVPQEKSERPAAPATPRTSAYDTPTPTPRTTSYGQPRTPRTSDSSPAIPRSDTSSTPRTDAYDTPTPKSADPRFRPRPNYKPTMGPGTTSEPPKSPTPRASARPAPAPRSDIPSAPRTYGEPEPASAPSADFEKRKELLGKFNWTPAQAKAFQQYFGADALSTTEKVKQFRFVNEPEDGNLLNNDPQRQRLVVIHTDPVKYIATVMRIERDGTISDKQTSDMADEPERATPTAAQQKALEGIFGNDAFSTPEKMKRLYIAHYGGKDKEFLYAKGPDSQGKERRVFLNRANREVTGTADSTEKFIEDPAEKQKYQRGLSYLREQFPAGSGMEITFAPPTTNTALRRQPCSFDLRLDPKTTIEGSFFKFSRSEEKNPYQWHCELNIQQPEFREGFQYFNKQFIPAKIHSKYPQVLPLLKALDDINNGREPTPPDVRASDAAREATSSVTDLEKLTSKDGTLSEDELKKIRNLVFIDMDAENYKAVLILLDSLIAKAERDANKLLKSYSFSWKEYAIRQRDKLAPGAKTAAPKTAPAPAAPKAKAIEVVEEGKDNLPNTVSKALEPKFGDETEEYYTAGLQELVARFEIEPKTSLGFRAIQSISAFLLGYLESLGRNKYAYTPQIETNLHFVIVRLNEISEPYKGRTGNIVDLVNSRFAKVSATRKPKGNVASAPEKPAAAPESRSQKLQSVVKGSFEHNFAAKSTIESALEKGNLVTAVQCALENRLENFFYKLLGNDGLTMEETLSVLKQLPSPQLQYQFFIGYSAHKKLPESYLKDNPEMLSRVMEGAKTEKNFNSVILLAQSESDKVKRQQTLDWVLDQDKGSYRMYSLLKIIPLKQKDRLDVQPLLDEIMSVLRTHHDQELLFKAIALHPADQQEKIMTELLSGPRKEDRSFLLGVINHTELPTSSRELVQRSLDAMLVKDFQTDWMKKYDVHIEKGVMTIGKSPAIMYGNNALPEGVRAIKGELHVSNFNSFSLPKTLQSIEGNLVLGQGDGRGFNPKPGIDFPVGLVISGNLTIVMERTENTMGPEDKDFYLKSINLALSHIQVRGKIITKPEELIKQLMLPKPAPLKPAEASEAETSAPYHPEIRTEKQFFLFSEKLALMTWDELIDELQAMKPMENRNIYFVDKNAGRLAEINALLLKQQEVAVALKKKDPTALQLVAHPQNTTYATGDMGLQFLTSEAFSEETPRPAAEDLLEYLKRRELFQRLLGTAALLSTGREKLWEQRQEEKRTERMKTLCISRTEEVSALLKEDGYTVIGSPHALRVVGRDNASLAITFKMKDHLVSEIVFDTAETGTYAFNAIMTPISDKVIGRIASAETITFLAKKYVQK